MVNITLLQLKYAIEIGKTGSFSAAAKNLYVNQTNISKSIKELEGTLGYPLFTRTPKGVIPTEEGKRFLSEAYDIVSKMESLDKLGQKEPEDQIILKISIPRATYITYAFTEFYKDIQDRDEISINFSETNTMEAVDNILYHNFDLGIIRYPAAFDKEFNQALRKKELSGREIWEFRYLLLTSEKSPLASKKEVYLSDLDDYTELVHGDIYVPFVSQEDYDKVNPSGSKKKRIYLYERGSQFDFLKNIDRTYMWVSPLPKEVLSENKLVQVVCRESTTLFKDVLIWRSNSRLSDIAKQFMMILEKVKEKMMETVRQPAE